MIKNSINFLLAIMLFMGAYFIGALFIFWGDIPSEHNAFLRGVFLLSATVNAAIYHKDLRIIR